MVTRKSMVMLVTTATTETMVILVTVVKLENKAIINICRSSHEVRYFCPIVSKLKFLSIY